MLTYKLRDIGIQLQLTQQSYTSKCSFLDKQQIKNHNNYKGERVKRGLFKTNKDIYLNADVNGSYNIMRKVIGDDIYNNIQPVEGLVLNPIKLNIV